MKSLKDIARPVIQGGMGVGVSGWMLAKASALAGAIGTVSGTAVAVLFVDALQKGDPHGHFRRALKHFPYPKISQEILDLYFVEGGIPKESKRKSIPMWSFNPPRMLISLTICANFSFVWLAKEGHKHPIFINYLEKIQMPHIYSILGAMLAGVNGIVMGAGIPKDIPAVIDAVLSGDVLSYPIFVNNHPNTNVPIKFDPIEFFGTKLPEINRPVFLPIISSHVLAERLLKICVGKIDGFIVETSTAGGHNAPPRGVLKLSDKGEPVYGEKDIANWSKMQTLNVPFWIAGSFASPEGLKNALELGASGIQAGTAFAFSEESGIDPELKAKALSLIYQNKIGVFTSPVASPTSFPFKLLSLSETLFDEEIYISRTRVCDLGYLREPCWNGKIILFRCPAEPVSAYENKGGNKADTVGRMCLCNALCSTVGARPGEKPVLTSGDDLNCVRALMQGRNSSYAARDVIAYILDR